MRHLIYCIFKAPKEPTAEMPPGVSGQPVFLVAGNGLYAAVSTVAESDIVPVVSRLLAYARVLESLHRCYTIIPIRYGCLFEGEAQIRQLLEQECGNYETLLEELKDCVEMGLRILLKDEGEKAESDSSQSLCFPLPISPASGTDYLAAQKDRYAAKDQSNVIQAGIVSEILSSMSGLFIRSKQESSRVEGRLLLSFYFLVPIGAVDSFRRASGNLHRKEAEKVLLSGPWLPYNFVSTANQNPDMGNLAGSTIL
jgi:hypothetical protein